MAQVRNLDSPPNHPVPPQQPAQGDPQFAAVGTMIAHAMPVQTGGVTGSQRVMLPPAVAAALSPEMLLAYVRTNLQDLDRQITGILHGLNDRREATSKLSAALVELRSLKSRAADASRPGDGDENDGYEFNAAERDHLMGVLTEAGFDDDQASAMISEFDGNASAGDIQGLIDSVSDSIGQLNNENEYDTMQITDLLSKRSNLIQMVSKMMASMDDAQRAIVQNIG